MLIEIHVIQNHSPANLNRDDLGAPKTCFFGGVLRSRISSQCLKRSIRMSEEFKPLLGGKRTRQLAKLIAEKAGGKDGRKRVEKILEICGFKPKKSEGDVEVSEKSKMLVYASEEAIEEMAGLLRNADAEHGENLSRQFAELIAGRTAVPDMALSGRMLEPDKSSEVWKGLDTTVEAALQVAHAISTHEARPEVDYYVAKDDVPGEDAGAGFVDEAMFASACFYKYFSIQWETLVKNLEGFGGGHQKLAAHTVGAFIRGAALVSPAGKQNSFAAHNPPDGVLVEIRSSPLSYANAFARPVAVAATIKEDGRDVISQSIAQLGQYVRDIDEGYGRPTSRFWFSPNLRYSLSAFVREGKNGDEKRREVTLADDNLKSLDDLIPAVVEAVGYDWEEVQRVVVNRGVA
jgi:CRISPR system Cascade subunit CasC